MGKKSKILYYSVLIVNIVCFILDLTPINFPFFRISFAVSLILIGILLIVRAFSLKLDSSMFFGVVLFICGILNFMLYFFQVYYDVDVNQFWPYYLFAVSIASLCTACYFKDKLQLKLFVLFLGFGLISLLYVQKLINLWWMIGLLIVWFVGYFIVNIVLSKKRRKDNGKER